MGQNNVNSIAVSAVTYNIVTTKIFGNNNFLTSANVSQSSVLLEVLTNAKPILEMKKIKTDLYLPLPSTF